MLFDGKRHDILEDKLCVCVCARARACVSICIIGFDICTEWKTTVFKTSSKIPSSRKTVTWTPSQKTAG